MDFFFGGGGGERWWRSVVMKKCLLKNGKFKYQNNVPGIFKTFSYQKIPHPLPPSLLISPHTTLLHSPLPPTYPFPTPAMLPTYPSSSPSPSLTWIQMCDGVRYQVFSRHFSRVHCLSLHAECFHCCAYWYLLFLARGFYTICRCSLCTLVRVKHNC